MVFAPCRGKDIHIPRSASLVSSGPTFFGLRLKAQMGAIVNQPGMYLIVDLTSGFGMLFTGRSPKPDDPPSHPAESSSLISFGKQPV